MGLLDSILGSTAEKVELENMKRGKSEEQKRVIDFFMLDEGCGCGGGCGGSGRRMTMSEYQQLVANRLYNLNLKERAIQKIGLDESKIREIQPIVLNGYAFDDGEIKIRIEGREAVASKFAVAWLFFGDTQIYTYTYKFDMISDNTWETTCDFFYHDVTCFAVRQRVVEKIDTYFTGCIKKGVSADKHNFIMDTLEITVPNAAFSFSMRNNETLEQGLLSAKGLLREKKFLKQATS